MDKDEEIAFLLRSLEVLVRMLNKREKELELLRAKNESPFMDGYEMAKEEYRPRLIEVEEKLQQIKDLLDTFKWKSADKDNMEFFATITCWQMDEIRKVLDND